MSVCFISGISLPQLGQCLCHDKPYVLLKWVNIRKDGFILKYRSDLWIFRLSAGTERTKIIKFSFIISLTLLKQITSFTISDEISLNIVTLPIVNPLRAKFFRRNKTSIIDIILPQCHDRGSWNPSACKTWTYLFYHGCWWPGAPRSQGISNHDIGLVKPG